MSTNVAIVRTPEERAEMLRWPDRRNCGWDCPWPHYCLDCHSTAANAMWDARRRLVSVLTGVDLATIRELDLDGDRDE